MFYLSSCPSEFKTWGCTNLLSNLSRSTVKKGKKKASQYTISLHQMFYFTPIQIFCFFQQCGFV